MTTAEQYRTASTSLYDQALIELDAGDTCQASEKLWGAAAQALKSLAERRGWRHGSHGEFYRIMRRVRAEFDDPDSMESRFDAAGTLHVNFYEDWLNDEEVRRRAAHVREFVDQLSEL